MSPNMSKWVLGGVLAVVDSALCLFVFFPLCVFHWRGTWNLIDYYVYENDEFISSWISLAVGSCTGLLFYFTQPLIYKWGETAPRLAHEFCTRLYLYMWAWSILFYWRGLWNLTDFYCGTGWQGSLVFYVVTVGITLAFRTCRSTSGLPVALQIDTDPDVLMPDTCFRTKMQEWWKFIPDVFFTQFVVISCNIMVWRGIWNILDEFFFPDDEFLSCAMSLVLGYACVIAFLLMEYHSSLASARLDNYPILYKIIYEDSIFIVVTWGVLMVWRAGWDMCKTFFLPDHFVGGWTCHAIGTVGLMTLQTFSNVGTNGIDLDGQYTLGEGVYPTKYLRYFLQDKLKMKYKYTEMKNIDDEDDAVEANRISKPGDKLGIMSQVFTKDKRPQQQAFAPNDSLSDDSAPENEAAEQYYADSENSNSEDGSSSEVEIFSQVEAKRPLLPAKR